MKLGLSLSLSLSLKEEYSFRVFENRVLRKIFGPKREEVAGSWKKLHNEELHTLYSSPNVTSMIKSRRMREMGHVACMEEMRNAYRNLVRKLKGRRPLRRPICRWEDNIKIDSGETGWKVQTGYIWLRTRTSGGLL